VVFFATAGAHLDLHLLAQIWPIALTLAVTRAGMTIIGQRVSSHFAGDGPLLRRWGWASLISQAGLTLGLSVVIEAAFPSLGSSFRSLVIATVAINEVVGPVVFKLALDRAQDGFWHCPSAREDTSLTVAGDHSPLLGYFGNMYAIGVTVTPWPEARPKKQGELKAPSRAKLFADNGANWQGASIQVTVESVFSTTPVTPVGLHRGGINVAIADGSARFANAAEFDAEGGPSVSRQQDERQNWWRDGAIDLVP
jgi:hypothetical protein